MKQLSIDAIEILKDCKFNWFMQYLQENNGESRMTDGDISLKLTDEQQHLVDHQSCSAYLTIKNEVHPSYERDAAANDGDIVTESDDQHPDC